MEKKTERTINHNGSFSVKETTTFTPEDGAVPLQDVRPAAPFSEVRGKSHIGYAATKTTTTNDPRITKPLVWFFAIVFLLVAFFAYAIGYWPFSIPFAGSAIFILVKGRRDVNRVAKKMEAQGQDATIDSPEELAEVLSGASGQLKNDMKESMRATFTKDHVHHFIKLTLPIYAVLTLAASLGMGFLVSKFLGIFVFCMLTVGGLLYFLLLLLLQSISSKK